MRPEVKVAVAMSGGVDSSVAAYLLKEIGYNVTGVFLTCWSKGVGCSTDADRTDALRVASYLKIPFSVYNFEKEYQQRVIDRFYEEYQRGLTPNPDIWCNEEIKFGLFLEKALEELKVDFIATGHYARIESREMPVEARDSSRGSEIENTDSYFTLYPHFSPSTFYPQPSSRTTTRHRYHLLTGVDFTKDQSYFLYRLNQFQLSKSLFPIGTLFKQSVREIAREIGLHTADKPDSQGICFVGNINLNEFLKERLPVKKGKVISLSGEIIGEHEGVWFYTIGQRHGFTIDKYQGAPLYVVVKNLEGNQLVVGRDEESEVKTFEVNDVHWVQEDGGWRLEVKDENRRWKVGEKQSDQFILKPQLTTLDFLPSNLYVRIRHLGELMPCRLGEVDSQLVVELERPTRGVATGQHAVFYKKIKDTQDRGEGYEVLGGGVIGKTQNAKLKSQS